MIEALQPGELAVHIPARTVAQDHQVRVHAGGTQERHQDHRLVLAVAEAALERLRGWPRNDRRIAELDSGVTNVRMQPGQGALDGRLRRLAAELLGQLERAL